VIDQLPEMPSMSDELPLAGSCQPSPVDSQTKGTSKPHSDLDIAMTTLSSSRSDIPETVTGDNTFRAHPSSSCEISIPTNTEKSFPTRTNWGSLIYLRDYELKREH